MQPFWRGSECDEGNSGYGVGRRTSHNPVAVALARDCAGRVGARLPCAVSPRLGPILMRVCRPFLPGGRAGNGRQGRNRRCALRAGGCANLPARSAATRRSSCGRTNGSRLLFKANLLRFRAFTADGLEGTIGPALRIPPCTDRGCWPSAPSGNWRVSVRDRAT